MSNFHKHVQRSDCRVSAAQGHALDGVFWFRAHLGPIFISQRMLSSKCCELTTKGVNTSNVNADYCKYLIGSWSYDSLKRGNKTMCDRCYTVNGQYYMDFLTA